MALQDILHKILDEAAEEVKRIEQETQNEKKTLEQESKAQEVQEKKEVEARKVSAIESLERKTEAMARREAKKQLLGAKHRIITTAMEKFHSHFCGLKEDAYGEILKQLFAKVENKKGIVLAPKDRVELTKKHAPSALEVRADDAVKGGFVVQYGTSEVDNSFHNLVYSEFRNDVETFFAQKLGLI
ncbi:MAG: V-type ATP synthase subunit E [Candidatus Gracilibacteria bacterium]|nr:V-type ATP synthase subunit E [Candidatus Gracilibacteria bacterium]